jgi:outer membrane protein assembly factor BamD (BamD/ComL family)
MPEVRTKYREARDRLSESDYLVGYFYFRQRWYPGAITRLKALLKDDPEYTGRDAVFYHLAESLARTKKEAEALPYFEKLVEEFTESQYLELAHKRISELKTQALAKPTGG